MKHPSKQHHYNPQATLRRFARDDGKVLVYRTLVSAPSVPIWTPRSTRSIGRLRHLYTRIVEGKESDEFETWINEAIETPGAQAIERAVNGEQLSRRHWEAIIRWFAAQDVRTPTRYMRRGQDAGGSMEEIFDQVVQSTAKKLENGGLIESGPDEYSPTPGYELQIKTSIEPPTEEGGDTTLKVEMLDGRNSWLSTVRRQLEYPWRVLLNHRWTILRPAKGFSWFTSDNPAVRLRWYSPTEFDLVGGWEFPGTELMLPLSPDSLLYAKVGSKPPRRGTRWSSEATKSVRMVLAKSASRMIFSHQEDPDVPTLRPRVVNAEKMRIEQEELRDWHKAESDAQAEFMAK